MKHRTIKIGTIKPYRLKASNKKIWSKFMTPEYVYTFGEYGDEYIYLRFEGYDRMEQIWRIVKIAEVKKIRSK